MDKSRCASSRYTVNERKQDAQTAKVLTDEARRIAANIAKAAGAAAND